MAMSVPNKIGRYDVIEMIGKGGMGVVYRAKDPALDRFVAIKIMTINYADCPDLLQRFYREAKATAFLQHPNIVTVYELGEHEGNPYFAMEYLEGASLDVLLRSGEQITLLQKIEIIVQTCQGLAYAHQRGIIHRDIKPGNIMVLKDGMVKIVDFGIARVGDTNFTRSGQFMGSLSYMSPEQLNEKLQIDQRTDVYSAGVVLYQMFTKKVPFEAESTAATLLKILNEPPPPFSRLLPDYVPEIEAITMKALVKDRDQRFPSVDDLAFELTQVRDRFRSRMVDSHMQRAQLLLQHNNLNEASDALFEVLKLDKQNTKAASLLRTLRKQIEREQSAERARQLRENAEAALQRKEFDLALAYLEQAISLDTTNVDLQQLRNRVYTAKSESEHLRQLRKQADEALVLRKWDQALALLDQAAAIDDSNPELIELRNSIRRSRTQRAEGLRRAEQARRAGDLTEAKLALEEVLALDPADSTAKALNAIVSKEIAERAKRKRLDELCLAARKHMSLRQFTTALDMLSQAKSIDASAPEIQELIDSATSAVELEKKRNALERACNEIEDLLNRDQYLAAFTRADEALRIFPQDQGLLALRSFAQEKHAAESRRLHVESQLASANSLLGSGQLQQAQMVLNNALKKYADETRLRSLLKTVTDEIAKQDAQCIEAERKADEKRRYVNAQLAAAADLQRSGQTEQALSKLEDALGVYPDSSELLNQVTVFDNILAREGLVRKQAEEEQKQKREEAVKAVALARQMMNAQLFSRAAETLEQALHGCPESDILNAELDIARRRLAEDMADQERVRVEKQRQQAEIDREILSATRLIELKQITQALTLLGNAAQRFPASTEIKSLIESTKYQDEQERLERIREEERLLRRRAEIADQITAARALLTSHQTSKAVASLERAVRNCPESEDLASLLREARDALKREQALEEEAEREARKRRGKIATELETARGLLKANQASKAVTNLQEALQRYPDSEELRSLLTTSQGRVSRELADREKEEKRQIELQSEKANAQALFDAGEPELAIAACEAALRKLGNDGALETLRAQARTAVKQKKALEKKSAEERKQATELIRRRERDLADLRGRAAHVSGAERPSAEKFLKQAQKITAKYPDDAEIQQVLKDLQRAVDSPTATEASQLPDESIAATRLLGAKAPPPKLAESEKAASATTSTVPSSEFVKDAFASLQSKLFNRWAAVGILVFLVVGLSVKFWMEHSASPQPPSTVIINIETNPTGAKIQVGDHSCVTPNCRLNLRPGEYEIHTEIDGYIPSSQHLTVDAKRPITTVNVELVRAASPDTAGFLIVKAGIAGAEVIVNGKRYSQTDSGGTLRLPLDPGPYRVEIKKKLYEIPKAQSVTIRTGKEITAQFKLTPLPTQAALLIAGAPPNVRVREDGRELGATDGRGMFSQSVDPGEHEIVVSDGTRESNPIRRNFASAERLTLDWGQFSMKPVPVLKAIVTVRNLPSGAALTADGSTYRADTWGTAQFEVPLGDHTLQISAEGYTPKEISRHFDKGETVIDGSLERLDLEKQDWEKLTSSGSLSDLNALQGFLNRYPTGTYAKRVQSTLDNLISNSESVPDLTSFYRRFPGTVAGEAARRRAEKLQDLTDRGKIVALLGTLEIGYSNKDSRQICEIWIGCPRRALEDEFRNFVLVDIKFQITRDLVQLWGGGEASAECRRVSNLTNRGSQHTTHSDNVRIKFRKQSGDWRIDSLEEVVGPAR